MAAAITSLGLGSDNVLSKDKIEKLKAASKAGKVDPYNAKIELNTARQTAHRLLSTYMNSFKSSASTLSFDTTFDDTTVTVSGSSKVKVSSGSSAKSFTLETTQLAKKECRYQDRRHLIES
jgi:flagellar capping protein FliD